MKWVGGLLQILAAALFVVTGAGEEVVLLIPAVASGLGGLWAWDRGARPAQTPPERPETSAELDRRLSRLEDVLLSMQSDVGQLREDREFFEKLYSARKQQALRSGETRGPDAPTQ